MLSGSEWYYILALSLQLAGTLILVMHYFSNTDYKVYRAYFADNRKAIVDDNGKTILDRDELRDLVYDIYLNRISFLCIAMGTLLGAWAEITISDKVCIIANAIVFAGAWIEIGIAIAHACSILKYKEDEKMDSKEAKEKYGAVFDRVHF